MTNLKIKKDRPVTFTPEKQFLYLRSALKYPLSRWQKVPADTEGHNVGVLEIPQHTVVAGVAQAARLANFYRRGGGGDGAVLRPLRPHHRTGRDFAKLPAPTGDARLNSGSGRPISALETARRSAF